jgi:putative membrane protein
MKKINILLKGAAMGIAEVIPGVSGGTIAFITGIYERLMNAIKAFDFSLIRIYKESSLGGVIKAIDLWFLCWLFGGMLGGLVVGAIGISYLFENYPLYVWGFFFGLILASAVVVMKGVGRLTLRHWILFIIGAAIAIGITKISPSEGNTSLMYIFFCGLIAITALMLPGISGSFILLLLGSYTYILGTFKMFLSTFSLSYLIVIIVFGVGCLLGVGVFSRVISWTLNNHRRSTLAILSGFLMGSLNKIWPWRIPQSILASDGQIYLANDAYPEGKIKVLMEENVMPNMYPADSNLLGVLVCFIVGILIVFLLDRKSVESNS